MTGSSSSGGSSGSISISGSISSSGGSSSGSSGPEALWEGSYSSTGPEYRFAVPALPHMRWLPLYSVQPTNSSGALLARATVQDQVAAIKMRPAAAASVIQHEAEVYAGLRDLWGVCVPEAIGAGWLAGRSGGLAAAAVEAALAEAAAAEAEGAVEESQAATAEWGAAVAGVQAAATARAKAAAATRAAAAAARAKDKKANVDAAVAKYRAAAASQREAAAALETMLAGGEAVEGGDPCVYLATRVTHGRTLAELQRRGELADEVKQAALSALDRVHAAGVLLGAIGLDHFQWEYRVGDPLTAANLAIIDSLSVDPVDAPASTDMSRYLASAAADADADADADSGNAAGAAGTVADDVNGSGGAGAGSVTCKMFIRDFEHSRLGASPEELHAERAELCKLLGLREGGRKASSSSSR